MIPLTASQPHSTGLHLAIVPNNNCESGKNWPGFPFTRTVFPRQWKLACKIVVLHLFVCLFLWKTANKVVTKGKTKLSMNLRSNSSLSPIWPMLIVRILKKLYIIFRFQWCILPHLLTFSYFSEGVHARYKDIIQAEYDRVIEQCMDEINNVKVVYISIVYIKRYLSCIFFVP